MLYLKPNSNWTQANARFAIHLCNGSTDAKWVDMTKEGSYYKATVPSGDYKNVIFCRMNPSSSTNDWNNNKWNQTEDLTYEDCKNLYTVKEDTWDKGGGTWSYYNMYFIAGNGTAGNAWCNGNNWEPAYCANRLLDTDNDNVKSITFKTVPNGNYEFKITNGSWNQSWGYEGGNYAFTTDQCSDVTVTFNTDTKAIDVDTKPIEGYVLRGVDDDWTTGIPLVVNDKNNNEVMLLNQPISRETDAVKVVYKNPCAESKYYGSVKLSSPVPYTFDDDGNILLEDGTYDFYFNKESKEIYIGGEVENLITVYLDPEVEDGTKWTSDNARFAVYYYKKGTEPVQAGWVSAKKDDNGLYYAQFPAAYDTYIWCRMDPNSGVNNWDGRWNQTDKIAYDADKPLTKLTSFGGPDKAEDKAASYQMINCTFPAIIPGEPVMVRINQSVESDPCNYLFKSFEDAWEVLKQNKDLCTVNGDAVTLKHPVNMLVTYVGEAYKGATAVEHTGGHVPTKVIMFKDINPNGGEPLVITTADPRGNRAVLVHPVVRDCKNITFDRLDIVGDKETKDNAMDIGVDMGETAHSMENMALIPRPDDAEPSNITIQNCKVESWGRNALHVVGAKGLHIENNEFFTRYDYSGTYDENVWAVDWAGTIKFVNSTDIKFLRNSSEGTLATSLFIQGCKRILVMNNVFWNDNAVKFNDLAKSDRTVASVRLVTYNNNDLKIENIGIYYNTFYIKDNEVGDGEYDHFDFFRLGGLMQNIDTEGERNAFNPEKIRFQYNNCYSYDDDIAGNNKDVDVDNQVKFYLQSFGHNTNWCQSFKYNNFWSEYDKDQEEKDPNLI